MPLRLPLQEDTAMLFPDIYRKPATQPRSTMISLSRRCRVVSQALDQAIPDPQVPLRHSDAFTLLIAVMLSAQCTDARVNKVTPALFQRAATPEEMAQLSPETVREYIATCGLTERKAASVVATSRQLVERFGGRVPASFEELESLPGVGHKTASVVMNQAFGVPAFPVDTHIFRLARLWKLSLGKTVAKVEEDLKCLFFQNQWGRLHLQMVLYGRQFCPARGCGGTCPVCKTLADEESAPPPEKSAARTASRDKGPRRHTRG